MGRTWDEALAWRSDENKDKRRLRLSMQAVAGVDIAPLEQPETPIKAISKKERTVFRERMYSSKPKVFLKRQPNKKIICSVIEELDIRI